MSFNSSAKPIATTGIEAAAVEVTAPAVTLQSPGSMKRSPSMTEDTVLNQVNLSMLVQADDMEKQAKVLLANAEAVRSAAAKVGALVNYGHAS